MLREEMPSPTPQLRSLNPVSEGESAKRVPERGGHIDMHFSICALLMGGPRTALGLIRTLNAGSSAIYRCLAVLRDKGLIYVSGWEMPPKAGRYMAIYRWQPSLFEHDDVPKPRSIYVRTGGKRQRVMQGVQA
jgi:hypothetical protein